MYNDKPFDPRDFKFTITTPDGEGAVDSWRITAAVDEKGERRVNIVEDDLKITRDEAVKSGKGAAEVITPDGAEVSIGSWKAHVHNRMILLNADDIKSGGNTVKVHVDCDVSGRKVSEEKELTLKAGVSNIWETSAAHQLRQQKAIIDAQQNIAHLENDINTCDIKIKQYENDLKANPYHLGDEHVLNSINGIIGGIELAALLDTQKRRETDRVSLDSERSRLARLQSGE